LIQLHPLRKLFLIILVPVMLISCQAGRDTVKQRAVTLTALAKKPARYEGKEIQLVGTYLGELNMGDPATLTGFIDWATIS